MSTARTAEMLGVSVQTIHRMIKAGELKAHKVRPRNSPWVVNYDSVLKRVEAIRKSNGLEKRLASEAQAVGNK